jgi:hypothetical protein
MPHAEDSLLDVVALRDRQEYFGDALLMLIVALKASI